MVKKYITTAIMWHLQFRVSFTLHLSDSIISVRLNIVSYIQLQYNAVQFFIEFLFQIGVNVWMFSKYPRTKLGTSFQDSWCQSLCLILIMLSNWFLLLSVEEWDNIQDLGSRIISLSSTESVFLLQENACILNSLPDIF